MQRVHNQLTYSDGTSPDKFAANEWPEYAHNSTVQLKFPDAFKDKTEFMQLFLYGDPDVVEDWSRIEGTDASTQNPDDYDGLLDKMWSYKGGEWVERTGGDEKQAKKDFAAYLDSLLHKAKKEQPEVVPPAIIGQHTNPLTGEETYYLISGNSRALLYAFMDIPLPIRIVPLKGRMLPDPTEDELQNILWPAEAASEDPEEKEQNVRAAVQKVIQQRASGEQTAPQAQQPPAPAPVPEQPEAPEAPQALQAPPAPQAQAPAESAPSPLKRVFG
jgi:hypothetical protein